MSTIILQVSNSVGVITLSREEKRNAFNREMALALQHALDECRDNDTVRAVVITGSGKAFSSGQDLAEFADPDGPGIEKILSEHYNPIVTRIRKLPKPVIAAVNGVAAGAAANIALACDIVIAAASASFIQAFSKIGLIPDSGGTFLLPRLVGWQRASALMMLGETVSAADAEKMGMIYKSVPDEQFGGAIVQMAAAIAQMPTRALALTKEALNASIGNNFDQQLDLERDFQRELGYSADYAEGVAAFTEKRSPRFTGR